MLWQINKELNVDEVSQSRMSQLRKKFHINVYVRKKGLTSIKCTVCESLKDLISKVGKNSANVKEHELKLKRHNKHEKSCRCLYHSWKTKSIQSKEEFCVSFKIKWII
jgi:hypothetical protein